jgi:predicted PurR-regulated permease PerM
MPTTESAGVRLLAAIAVVAVLWALKWTAPISMPLGAAVFLIAVLWPIKRLSNRLVPEPASYAVAILAMILVLALFCGAVWASFQNILGQFEDYRGRFDRLYGSAQDLVESYGLSLPDLSGRRIMGMLQSVAGALYSWLATIGLILALVIMGFPAVAQISAQMRGSMPERAREIAGPIRQIAGKFQGYVATTTLNCLITGLLSYVFALAVGLEFALTWAVLTFLLNYIPTIGSVLSIFPPTLFALVQFDGSVMPAAVFAGFAAIQLAMGTFVFPKLSGEKQAVLPVFVLVAMVVWGWLWGIPGALIGVPLTTGLLIACAQFDSTRWLAVLATKPGSSVAQGPEPEPPPERGREGG